MKNKITSQFILNTILIFILVILPVSSYESDSDYPVHQYITNESKYLWNLTPYEMKTYFKHSIYDSLDTGGYDNDEGIIIGSGEEDTEDCPWPGGWPWCDYYKHFWEPDNPLGGNYDDGLNFFGRNYDSSYERAVELWKTKVIPYYRKGEIDKSYYWLGRVVHLLEDATTPAHMHNDPHPIVKSLENYTKYNYQNWQGSNYEGDLYYYEDLPNIAGFDWSQVDAKDKQYIEFFRLFWYVAQKTQYYASDDEDGNDNYREIDDTLKDFSTEGYDLWSGEGVTIITDQNEVADNVSKIADAVIPHSMKSVAGLYRLFWDTVNSYDWPTFHHDNRRTGFTLLKGDMEDENDVREYNLVLHGDVTTDAVSRASMADLDNNGRMDIVVGASKTTTEGWLYRLESNNDIEYKGITIRDAELKKKWTINLKEHVPTAPSLADTYGDEDKEIIIGLENGTLMAFEEDGDAKWSFTVDEKSDGTTSFRGELGFTAVEDIDNDGKKEIIFTDSESNYDWDGTLYILEDNGNSYTVEDVINQSHGGANGAVSLANIDSDDYTEIIVPTFQGIYVYDYDGNSLTKKYNNTDGRLDGAVAVYDIDNLKGEVL